MSKQLQYLGSYFDLKHPCIDPYLTHWAKAESRKVLELGTRRWGPDATHHKECHPGFQEYVLSDVREGFDVDHVADAHALSTAFGEARFDFLWASSVWEHLAKPWIASQEVLKVLKPGGCFFIQTHHSFPIHGYPHDYFRFTQEGLRSCFEGAIDIVTCYDYPAKLDVKVDVWDPRAPVYLNVCIFGRKPL